MHTLYTCIYVPCMYERMQIRPISSIRVPMRYACTQILASMYKYVCRCVLPLWPEPALPPSLQCLQWDLTTDAESRRICTGASTCPVYVCTCVCMYVYKYTHIHTHTHTKHTYTYTLTQTHTHTHTHRAAVYRTCYRQLLHKLMIGTHAHTHTHACMHT